MAVLYVTDAANFNAQQRINKTYTCLEIHVNYSQTSRRNLSVHLLLTEALPVSLSAQKNSLLAISQCSKLSSRACWRFLPRDAILARYMYIFIKMLCILNLSVQFWLCLFLVILVLCFSQSVITYDGLGRLFLLFIFMFVIVYRCVFCVDIVGLLVHVTSPNINRFSKFFHFQTQ